MIWSAQCRARDSGIFSKLRVSLFMTENKIYSVLTRLHGLCNGQNKREGCCCSPQSCLHDQMPSDWNLCRVLEKFYPQSQMHDLLRYLNNGTLYRGKLLAFFSLPYRNCHWWFPILWEIDRAWGESYNDLHEDFSIKHPPSTSITGSIFAFTSSTL